MQNTKLVPEIVEALTVLAFKSFTPFVQVNKKSRLKSHSFLGTKIVSNFGKFVFYKHFKLKH